MVAGVAPEGMHAGATAGITGGRRMDHRQSLPLAALILDADVQPRETMSSGLIHEYATLYREGHALPPIKVFHDGRDNWVADGFHRVSAVREAGLSEIHAEVAPG